MISFCDDWLSTKLFILTITRVTIGKDEMQTPTHNPETMETNIKGVYLAGVICGGLQTNKCLSKL